MKPTLFATVLAASLAVVVAGASPSFANPEDDLPKLLTVAEAQQATKSRPLQVGTDPMCFDVAYRLCEASFAPKRYGAAGAYPGSVAIYTYASPEEAQAAFAKRASDRTKPVTGKREPGDPPPAKPKVITSNDSRITVTAGNDTGYTDGLFGNVIVSIECRIQKVPKGAAAARKQLTKCLNGASTAQVAKLGLS